MTVSTPRTSPTEVICLGVSETDADILLCALDHAIKAAACWPEVGDVAQAMRNIRKRLLNASR